MTGRSSLPRRAADESTRPFRQGRFGFWFHPFARSLTMPHQRSRSTKQCCSPSLPRSAKIGRARDLNPGPHGPELGDVPSSNVGTIDFRSILLRRPPIPSRFETFFRRITTPPATQRCCGGITLWLFGGVSRFTSDTNSPGTQALFTFVGPLTTLVLGAVFYVISIAAGSGAHPGLVAPTTTSLPAALGG